jgi:hypothetical protein
VAIQPQSVNKSSTVPQPSSMTPALFNPPLFNARA